MAQRAAEANLKPTVIKDPLLAQNRALSAFAVLLLLALLTVVVLETTNQEQQPRIPACRRRAVAAGNSQTAVPTALFPTPIPTAHPDPRSAARRRQSGLYPARKRPGRSVGDQRGRKRPAPPDQQSRRRARSRLESGWARGSLLPATATATGNCTSCRSTPGAITRLTYTPGFEGAPTWSPDGA